MAFIKIFIDRVQLDINIQIAAILVINELGLARVSWLL